MMTPRSESRQVSDNLPVQWSEAEQWFAELTKEFGYEYFFAGEIEKKITPSRCSRRPWGVPPSSKFPAAQEFSRALKVIFLLYKHYHPTQQCITFQDITVLCSNDYLGMPALTGATGPVIDYGVGTGGTRNIWCNSVLHENLENEIASLNKKEAALILSSFYVANDTTLFTLAPSFQDTSTSRSFPPGPWARFTATSGDMWPPPAMEQVNWNWLSILKTRIIPSLYQVSSSWQVLPRLCWPGLWRVWGSWGQRRADSLGPATRPMSANSAWPYSRLEWEERPTSSLSLWLRIPQLQLTRSSLAQREVYSRNEKILSIKNRRVIINDQ